MKFELHNINKIHDAEVQLNGLTVIVGNNDTGKSTIGRLLFTCGKTLTEVKETKKEDAYRKVQYRIQRLYRQIMETIIVRNQEYIKQGIPGSSIEFFREMINSENELAYLREKLDCFTTVLPLTPRLKNIVIERISECIVIIEESRDISKLLNNRLEDTLESEFQGQVLLDESSSFRLSEEDNVYICKEKGSERNHIMKDGFFKDITYVESPLYFHLMKALSRGIILQDLSNRRKSGVVPYHIQDLIDKLNNAHLNEIESGNRNIIDNLQIEKIIGGIFRYSDNKRTIVFKRYDGREFSPLNVASGIKSFGVLQLLAKGNYLTSDSLLIWDEPENHLHPEWQLEFAHVLVCLSAQGVPVLVTTHSPYFLQAIRYYAAEEEMSKFVNYYITVEREDQTIDLENVTCDLNRAFIKMAEPLNRIMNIVHKEVEEKIRKE